MSDLSLSKALDPTHQNVHKWNGKALKGTYHVTIKVDGVRALWKHDVEPPVGTAGVGHWESRAGKPLYNIPAPFISVTTEMWWPGVNCELFLGSLKDTVRACRTQHLKPDTPAIRREHLYSLDPIDPRLDLGLVENPTAEWLTSKLATVNAQGFEGLVLRRKSDGQWIKVKPHDNYDVLVTGAVEGTGKHQGRMGYLQTHMGDVGTGFTDKERELWWMYAKTEAKWTGHTKEGGRTFHWQASSKHVKFIPRRTIEVECMQLTPDGKFRHARFIRERFDKVADK